MNHINEYSTHLPLFEKLFNIKKFPKILEFGLGFGSTPFLLKNCEHLTSIEMQSQTWYNIFYSELKDENKWNCHLSLGSFEFQKLSVINDKYDLIFVDGHGDSRPEIINLFFEKCDTIVAHDFETASYRWSTIKKPIEYELYVFTELNPYTAVFTKDFDVKKALNI